MAAEEIDPDPETHLAIERGLTWLVEDWKQNKWHRKEVEHYSPTINVRSILPLKIAGHPVVDKILDHYLQRIQPNGFPSMADAQEPGTPLTHHVMYVARGLWECGVDRLAKQIMNQLANLQSLSFPARIDKDFQPVTDEVCNVAVAQAAVLWEMMGSTRASLAREYLRSLDAPWGSNPIDGSYFPNTQPSWCAKFVADALLPNENNHNPNL
jgi:hypothetical protein